MNLIKMVNKNEDLAKDKIYQIITEFFNLIEKKTNQVNDSILENINNIVLIEAKQNIPTREGDVIIDLGGDLCDMYEDCLVRILAIVDFKIFPKNLIKHIRTQANINLLERRRLFLIKKYSNILRNLAIELFNNLTKDIKEFLEENNPLNQDNTDIIEQSQEIQELPGNTEFNNSKNKLHKIFDYKLLERVAETNGYEYKWTNGSHKIFEHFKSNKIIVIPAHKIGLGLSIKIQKQIYNNAN